MKRETSMRPNTNSSVLAVLAGSIAAGIFVLDTIVPLEVALAVLYVAVVLIAATFMPRRGVLLVTMGCVGLSVISHAISLHGPPSTIALVNLGIGAAAIVISAYLALLNQAVVTESRERASLLDVVHDAIFVRDLDDAITYWNRGAEERYGWTSDQVLGPPATPMQARRSSSPCRRSKRASRERCQAASTRAVGVADNALLRIRAGVQCCPISRGVSCQQRPCSFPLEARLRLGQRTQALGAIASCVEIPGARQDFGEARLRARLGAPHRVRCGLMAEFCADRLRQRRPRHGTAGGPRDPRLELRDFALAGTRGGRPEAERKVGQSGDRNGPRHVGSPCDSAARAKPRSTPAHDSH
jgi:PAS domain-containing protein